MSLISNAFGGRDIWGGGVQKLLANSVYTHVVYLDSSFFIEFYEALYNGTIWETFKGLLFAIYCYIEAWAM